MLKKKQRLPRKAKKQLKSDTCDSEFVIQLHLIRIGVLSKFVIV